jgi:hypothetical protein
MSIGTHIASNTRSGRCRAVLSHAPGESEHCVLSKCLPFAERAPHVVHQRIQQDPGHSAVPSGMIGRSLRPQIRVQHERSGVVTAGDQFRRPPRPLLLNGQRPNSTFARHRCEKLAFSITAGHASSSTDAEKRPLRAPDACPTPAEPLARDHVVSSVRVAPRARREQDKEQDNSCAILGELDRN